MQPGASSMIQGLAGCFTGLEDPRETSRCDHQLIDILVIAVCAVIACAESWEDIALYGRSKQAWLATFLALPNGIPSHDTFRRVFMLIDPDAFEGCFARWVQSGAGGVAREVVAVDGKTVRRSGSRRHDHGPLHVVSAWASGQGLGQRSGAGAWPTRCRRQVERDHRYPGVAGDLAPGGLHRDAGCDGLPKGHRRADPGQGRRLPPGAQGQSRSRLCGYPRAFRADLLGPGMQGDQCSTPLTRVTVAWSAGASLWPRRSRISSPCTAGPTCGRFWRWRQSGA